MKSHILEMNLRHKIFQKIAAGEPRNKVLHDHFMKSWDNLIRSGRYDIFDEITNMLNMVANNLEIDPDWDRMVSDIQKEHFDEGQALLNDIGTLKRKQEESLQNPVVPTQKEAVNTFMRTVEVLIQKNRLNPDRLADELPGIINSYSNIISDWGWLQSMLIKNSHGAGLLVFNELFPGTVNQTVLESVVQNGRSNKAKYEFLQKYVVSNDADLKKLCQVMYTGDGFFATEEGFAAILATQKNNSDVLAIPYKHFRATGDETGLDLYKNYPDSVKYYLRDSIERNPQLLEDLLNKWFTLLSENDWIYIFDTAVLVNRDSDVIIIKKCPDSAVRCQMVLRVLAARHNSNVQHIIDLLNANEINFVADNLFDIVDYSDHFAEMLFISPATDKVKFISKIIEHKNYGLGLKIMISKEVMKNDVNVVILQKFIEDSGDPSLVRRAMNSMASRDKKINFTAGKRKYNDLFAKTRFKNPGDAEEFLDDLKRNRFFSGNEHVQSFLDEAFAKKDWFYLDRYPVENLFDMPLVDSFLNIKGKSGRDLYHEVKNDNLFVLKCNQISEKLKDYGRDSSYILTSENREKMVAASTNFGQLIKWAERVASLSKLIHDIGFSIGLGEQALFNTNIDMDSPSTKEFLETYYLIGGEDTDYFEKQIAVMNEAAKNKLIDLDSFKSNYAAFRGLLDSFALGKSITMQKGSELYEAFKNLHSQINLINQFENIQEYLVDAAPKNPEMLKLDWVHPSGLTFSVLKYLDPYAFKVGADTECCQRIGGAGADAAIDSFINPLAGVLVLKNQEQIIAQSYFHFVPETNGIILDNVEWNSQNAGQAGLNTDTLSRAYYDYAVAMKQNNQNISYIRCGLDYNKLSDRLFQKVTLEKDPRSFTVNPQDPYSDFDHNSHLDLLSPVDEINHLSVKTIRSKQAYVVSYDGMNLSMVRLMLLRRRIGL